MKIVRLGAENFKRLVAVEIVPDGNVVKITGPNGAGKTSVLDSIWATLGGAKATPAKPVRDGERKAIVVVDLGELVITKTFSESGAGQLKIENGEGMVFKSPQTMLDKLIGSLSFDPLAFQRMKPMDQLDALRSVCGLGEQFDSLDAYRKDMYTTRRDLKRDLQPMQAEEQNLVNAIGSESITADRESVDDVMVEFNGANAINIERTALKADFRNAEENLERLKAKRKEIDDEIGNVEHHIKSLKESAKDLPRTPDMDLINQRLERAQKFQRLDGRINRLADVRTKMLSITEEIDGLTHGLDEVDIQKQMLFNKAEMPLDGLTFDADGVSFKGQPFLQASGAEQLRVSMAIAMALNPTLRVIRVADASLFDSKSLKIVEDMANDKDFQIWMEMVDESESVGVVIEDGMVKNG